MAIQSGGAPAGAAQRGSGSGNLAELLSVILDKGIVIDAWARVSIIGIEILTVEARVVVASVDTYLRYAEAIGLTALASAPNAQGQSTRAGGQSGSQQPQLPPPEDIAGYIEDHPQGVDLGDLQAYFDAPRDELSGVLRDLVSDGRAREDDDRYYPPDDEGE